MQILPVLLYGVLIFLGTEVVSIPFGAIYKFQDLRGVTSSLRTRPWLSSLEHALECVVVIWFTFKVSQTHSQIEILPAFAAFGVAVLIAYPCDVLWARQPRREFAMRAVFAAVFCVPAGVYLAGWSTASF